MGMPIQKPGRSKQDYQTPPEFIAALKKHLHIAEFGWDLAASEENTVASHFITKERDSLNSNVNWHAGSDWGFCNPPYANIRPWVQKAYTESLKGAQIAMLVPASVGANWWSTFVHDAAYALFLNGRLTFVGETAPYPKDMAILLYTRWTAGGNTCWRWRDE